MNDTQIVSIIKDNFIKKSSYYTKHLEHFQHGLTTSYYWQDTGLATDMFNVLISDRRASYAKHIHYFRAQARPYAAWCFAWESEENGLALQECETLMHASLCEARTEAFPHAPEIEIIRVQTESEVKEFSSVLCSLFDDAPEKKNIGRYYNQIAAYIPEGHAILPLYLLRKDGVAVTTGSICYDHACAGIYDIATRTTHRNKGYALQMFRYLLEEIRCAGKERAVLMASDAGRSIYGKCGFISCGKVNTYGPR